jgi:hypothetical protein
MAEIVAGGIEMGLGGYGGTHRQEHFASQERWEFAEVESLKDREVAEVKTIFEEYALIGEHVRLSPLLLFGALKGWLKWHNVIKASLQTAAVGGLAAATAYYLAHLFG